MNQTYRLTIQLGIKLVTRLQFGPLEQSLWGGGGMGGRYKGKGF